MIAPAVKSRALYHSFLDVDAIDAAGLAAIEDQLASIDEAEDKAALTRALGAMNPTGGPDLIGIAVYGDPGAPETNVVHIEQDGLDLPDRGPTTGKTITRQSVRRMSRWSPSS